MIDYDDKPSLQSTRLIGGFHVCLSPNEVNLWHEYINGLPIWKEFRMLEVEVDSTVQGGKFDVDYSWALNQLMRLEEELYKLSKEWVKNLKESRKQLLQD